MYTPVTVGAEQVALLYLREDTGQRPMIRQHTPYIGHFRSWVTVMKIQAGVSFLGTSGAPSPLHKVDQPATPLSGFSYGATTTLSPSIALIVLRSLPGVVCMVRPGFGFHLLPILRVRFIPRLQVFSAIRFSIERQGSPSFKSPCRHPGRRLIPLYGLPLRWANGDA